MAADTLGYDDLIDDYIRMNNDFVAMKELFETEKEKSKYLAQTLENCLLNQKKAKRRVFWASVKHTIRDLGIGFLSGFLIEKIR